MVDSMLGHFVAQAADSYYSLGKTYDELFETKWLQLSEFRYDKRTDTLGGSLAGFLSLALSFAPSDTMAKFTYIQDLVPYCRDEDRSSRRR